MSRCLSTLPNNQVGSIRLVFSLEHLCINVPVAKWLCWLGVHRELGRPWWDHPLQARGDRSLWAGGGARAAEGGPRVRQAHQRHIGGEVPRDGLQSPQGKIGVQTGSAWAKHFILRQVERPQFETPSVSAHSPSLESKPTSPASSARSCLSPTATKTDECRCLKPAPRGPFCRWTR